MKLPKKTTIFILTILDKLGLSPFAPYHYKAFGESVMFKPSKAYELVNFTPKKNNVEILVDAFESFNNNINGFQEKIEEIVAINTSG